MNRVTITPHAGARGPGKDGRGYLSVADWGPVAGPDRVAVLAAACGMDPSHGMLVSRRKPPCILAVADAETAKEMARALNERGIAALAPTRAQLGSMGEPFRVKSLEPAAGATEAMYLARPWRGEPMGLRMRDVAIIVRARLENTARTTSVTPVDRTLTTLDPELTLIRAAVAPGDAGRSTRMRVRTRDIADVWLRDRSRLRFDADKLSFDMLGKEKGMSDGENMNRLTLRLTREAPRAILDLGFSEFAPPPDVVTRHAGASFRNPVSGDSDTVTTSEHGPAFEFYSPWIAMVYARLAKR
ncbi:MAG: hypothetical protein JNM07_12445 [Phycisphaerae bacterium]|nr:hypothetical protein [Phycisphaerae bacterium]